MMYNRHSVDDCVKISNDLSMSTIKIQHGVVKLYLHRLHIFKSYAHLNMKQLFASNYEISNAYRPVIAFIKYCCSNQLHTILFLCKYIHLKSTYCHILGNFCLKMAPIY